MHFASEENSLHSQIRKRLEQKSSHCMGSSVTVNAGGTRFETSAATLASQPESQLAKLALHGEQMISLDICPKAFEILLNFLRCGARKIPPGSTVCAESIGYAAQSLGLNICLKSKCRPGFCKKVWLDERKAKPRFISCRELGLKDHRNSCL